MPGVTRIVVRRSAVGCYKVAVTKRPFGLMAPNKILAHALGPARRVTIGGAISGPIAIVNGPASRKNTVVERELVARFAAGGASAPGTGAPNELRR